MKYFAFIFSLSIFFLIGCDENSNFNTTGPIPDDEESRCFTIEEVSASDCPSELLTNICSTYSCNFRIGDIEADGSWPPCPGDPNSCEFVDCTTLICGGSIRYNISVTDGGLGYSFDTLDSTTGQPTEVRVTCFEGGFLSFECGDGGTIFN